MKKCSYIHNSDTNPALNEIKKVFADVKPIVYKYAKNDKAVIQEMLSSLTNMEKDLKFLAKYEKINESSNNNSYPNEIMYEDAAKRFGGFTVSKAMDVNEDYYEIFIFPYDMVLAPWNMSIMHEIDSDSILKAINVSNIETINMDKVYPQENELYPKIYSSEASAFAAARYISRKYSCCVGVCFDEFNNNGELIISDHDMYFYSGVETNAATQYTDGQDDYIYAVFYIYAGGEQFNVIMYTDSYEQALSVAEEKSDELDHYDADDESDITMVAFNSSEKDIIIPLLVKSMDENNMDNLQKECDELDKHVVEYYFSRL